MTITEYLSSYDPNYEYNKSLAIESITNALNSNYMLIKKNAPPNTNVSIDLKSLNVSSIIFFNFIILFNLLFNFCLRYYCK